MLYNFAYAEECVKVCVDKISYDQGDPVIISSKSNAFLPGTQVLIQVFDETKRVHIAQVDVAQDGSFAYSKLIADGPFFKVDGKYTVRVSDEVKNTFETSFDFQTNESGLTPSQIFDVKAGDQGTFDVPYTIKGGTVKNIIVDPSILGIIVTIQADNDGSITLDLGRKWIDAKKTDGTDDTYIIYIDGLEVQYQESSVKPDSRLLTIQFEEGDSDIEIIGTSVVPEFGPIAIVILVIAISSGMVLSRKNALLRIN